MTFDALTAERPYRAAMPVSEALAIMTDMVDTAIDEDCFDALRRALAQVDLGLAEPGRGVRRGVCAVAGSLRVH